MKVIYARSVLEKINDVIDNAAKPNFGNAAKPIDRIELTSSEFRELLCSGASFEYKWICNGLSDLSGSHVVYRGICIQTHESYGGGIL